MNLHNFGQKFKRLGKVIYWLVLLVSSLIAILGTFSDTPYSGDGWLAYFNPTLYLLVGLWMLGIIATLEIIRRIFSYVSDETDIFKKTLPFGVKYYIFFIGLVFVVFVGLHFAYPSIEKQYSRNLANEQVKIFNAFLDNYPSELKKGRACFEKAKDDYYADTKPTCDAEYRQAKLNYQSCTEFSSRTFCLTLAGHDYESIDCSKDALTKNMSYSRITCDLTAVDAEGSIKSYLIYYKNLDMSERVKVLRKMLIVVKGVPDSNFTTILAEKVQGDYFKEEALEMKQEDKK